jgi:hypothetical protein
MVAGPITGNRRRCAVNLSNLWNAGA